MDKAKEILSDPAKLEATLKQAWAKLDPQNQGFVTYDTLKAALSAQAKALGMPERQPTPQEVENAKKLADPQGTGKVTFEGFVNLVKGGIEVMKKQGKINGFMLIINCSCFILKFSEIKILVIK